MFAAAAAGGGGVFVLALTSNPEGHSVQFAKTSEGRTVAQLVLDEIAQLNAGLDELGDIGVVVGPRSWQTGHDLSRVAGPILVPGLGAQGGTPDDLRILAGENRSAILPSYSREILASGPGVIGLRDAARRARDACRDALAPPA
jgi:orotidine-5'-phosphate decarboxylase